MNICRHKVSIIGMHTTTEDSSLKEKVEYHKQLEEIVTKILYLCKKGLLQKNDESMHWQMKRDLKNGKIEIVLSNLQLFINSLLSSTIQ